MISACIRLIALVALFASVQVSLGQRCVEVSSDGQAITTLCDDQLLQSHCQSTGGIAGGVPFGLTPNWQNSIRRQVGSVAVADMDNDGDLDVVVGCFNSSSFPPYDDWRNFMYRNVGGQLEATPSWISTDQVHTGDIAIADFNHDDFKDIFAANGGGSMSPSVIYYGAAAGPSTSPGWFSAYAGNTWATSALAFDFNHDTFVDIVTTNQSPIQGNPYRPILLYRNINGLLENAASWQSAEHSIQNGTAAGDFNNDGWEDLASAKWVNFQCSIYMSNAGTLATTPAWTNGITDGGRGAAVADLDNNGLLDVIYGLAPAMLYSQTSPGVFANTWTSAAPVPGEQEIKLHDVDGDGDKDYAEVHFSTGRCHIYLNNNGVLDTIPTWTYDSPLVGNTLAFGDINGDGCDDLIIGYSGLPSVVVFYAERLPPCPADNTGNGFVNVDDLLGVINNWGGSDQLYDIAPPGGNGVVNVDDLLAIINAWGPCP